MKYAAFVFCSAALFSVACDGADKSSADGSGGGAGGTASDSEDAAHGGEGGADSCPSIIGAGFGVCLATPGDGVVWGYCESLGMGGAGTGDGGAGGDATSGCVTTKVGGWGGSMVECQGLAHLSASNDEGHDWEARYEDGSVALLRQPDAWVPPSGEVELSLRVETRRDNPFGFARLQHRIEGRDQAGKLLWLDDSAIGYAEIEALLGAPTKSQVVCQRTEDFCGPVERSISEHLLSSEPELLIQVGKPTTVDVEGASYSLFWYESSVRLVGAGCSDGYPASSGQFVLLLQP